MVGFFTVKHVALSDVLELSVPERIKLAQAIWDSVAQVPEAVRLTDSEREELDCRLEAYYRDPGAGSSWEDVKARIKARTISRG